MVSAAAAGPLPLIASPLSPEGAPRPSRTGSVNTELLPDRPADERIAWAMVPSHAVQVSDDADIVALAVPVHAFAAALPANTVAPCAVIIAPDGSVVSVPTLTR